MKVIKIQRGLRQGQTLFNFLEWLMIKGYAPESTPRKIADPFNLSDKEFNAYYKEFLEENQQV